jgi:hypothetical protein
VATWIQAVPFQFTAATTEPVPVALGAVPTAQASVDENAWTCSMALSGMLLGTVSCDHALPLYWYASVSTCQPLEVGMVPFPMAITLLAEVPLTPVRLQSASNTLHGPVGSALCEWPAGPGPRRRQQCV